MAQQPSRRKNTRSKVWDDIEATISLLDPLSDSGRNVLHVNGKIGDISATGMFFQTAEDIPVPSKAEISIEFDPKRPGNLTLQAIGETVRTSAEGVGVRFTSINLQRLQQCIMSRMNNA